MTAQSRACVERPYEAAGQVEDMHFYGGGAGHGEDVVANGRVVVDVVAIGSEHARLNGKRAEQVALVDVWAQHGDARVRGQVGFP